MSVVNCNDCIVIVSCYIDRHLLRIFMIHRNITFIAKNNSSNNHIKRSSENFEINNKAIKTTNA